MNKSEINKKIAELNGWTNIKKSGLLIPNPPYIGYPPTGQIIGNPKFIPDYCGDSNLMRKVLSTIDNKITQIKLAMELNFILNDINMNSPGYFGPTEFMRMTVEPYLLAIAYLKTLNAYVE